MRVRQVDWYWNQGKYIHYVGVTILRMLGHFSLWQWILRNGIQRLEPIPGYLYEIMNRHKPDVVFAPTMIPREEVALLRLAKQRGIATVGMFKSWDNPTSKAFLRIFPDRIICHTEHVKQEAHELYGYPFERMIVTGVPQFDEYVHVQTLESRDAFFENLGLDSKKKLIVYAPAGDWMSMTDKETLEILLDAIDRGEVRDVQVLLRLHPAYESKAEELKGRAHLIVERPGVYLSAKLRDVELDLAEMRHLASMFAYADVSINTASTLTIESAIFDTPVVLIGFDGREKKPYWQSVVRYYDREHYVKVLKTHAARLVKSPDEFIEAINAYLHEPDKDSAQRAQLVREQCFQLDGKAGKRVADAILRAV